MTKIIVYLLFFILFINQCLGYGFGYDNKIIPRIESGISSNIITLNSNQSQSNFTLDNIYANNVYVTNTVSDWISLQSFDGTPITWNSDEFTYQVPTGVGGVIRQLGAELVMVKKNNAGKTLYNGQLVYSKTSQGERILVDLADANASVNKIDNIGMVTADFCNNNADCAIAYFGNIRGLDLSVYNEGDKLYLKCDGSGNFTNEMQTNGCYNIHIGQVKSNSAVNGIIDFHVEMIDISDNPVMQNLKILDSLSVDSIIDYVPPHMFGISTNHIIPLAVDTWYNISFNTSLGDIEKIYFNGGRNTTVTINTSGHYQIDFEISLIDTKPIASGEEAAVRITKNNVELLGSYNEATLTSQNQEDNLRTFVHDYLNEGDNLTMQYIVSDTDIHLDSSNMYSDYGKIVAKGYIERIG